MFYRILLTSVLIVAAGPAFAKRKKKRTEKTLVVPELSVRSGILEKRNESVYHRDTHTDNATHFYLSLKLVRTSDYVNEVVLEPAFRSLKRNPEKKEFVLDQGYIASGLGSLDLTVGKKTEFSGSGFFVNPSDLLNEDKDIYDPLYQRQGKVFGRLRWRAGDFSIASGYIPEENQAASRGKIWGQMGADVWETDIRLQYIYKENSSKNGEHDDLSTFGLSAARFFGDHFELHYDGRFQSRQRNIADQEERKIFDCDQVDKVMGPNACLFRESPADTAALPYENTDSSLFHVLGSRFVFSGKRSMVLEGIQNQSGLQKDEVEHFLLYKKAELDDETASGDESTTQDPIDRIIGRRYVFWGYQDEDTFRKTAFNFGSLHSLTDGSTYLVGEWRYTLSAITNVSFSPNFYLGDELTEFGEQPFSSQLFFIFRGRF